MNLKSIIFFFTIFQISNIYSRCSFLIIERASGKAIGISFAGYLYEDNYGNEISSLVYILEDGKKFIEFKDIESNAHRAISYLHWKEHISWEKTGVEKEYRIFIKLNEKEYNYKLFGDVVYLYLIDENGEKRMNKDAIEYIIKKDEEVREFFEILLSTKFKFDDPFQYVFDKKKAAEKLGLKRKKYKFKAEYIPCTETEKILGYECERYVYEIKNFENCRHK